MRPPHTPQPQFSSHKHLQCNDVPIINFYFFGLWLTHHCYEGHIRPFQKLHILRRRWKGGYGLILVGRSMSRRRDEMFGNGEERDSMYSATILVDFRSLDPPDQERWTCWEWLLLIGTFGNGQYCPLSDRFTSLGQELPQELDNEGLRNNVFSHNIHSLSDG